MVTEVKMQVTPDLSRRVQEIVFKNGGSWGKNTNIVYTDKPYLFIDRNKELSYGENKDFFDKKYYKEISPYDFIASQGKQMWLPKYGEEALFSDNKEI